MLVKFLQSRFGCIFIFILAYLYAKYTNNYEVLMTPFLIGDMATATLGSAAIGGGSSLLGGLFGKGSAKKARKRLVRGAIQAGGTLNTGHANTLNAISDGYDDVTGTLENYGDLGEGALAKLAWGLGFNVPGFDTSGIERGGLLKNFSEEDFRTDPGYNFIRSEGQRGIQNSAAARGSLLSGATLKALTRFNQNTADQQYQNAYNRYNQDRKFQAETLAGVAGRGQLALTQTGNWLQNKTNAIAGAHSTHALNTAGLQLGAAQGSANLALRGGNYAQNAMTGIGNSALYALGSFYSKPGGK